jgi:hypothetical protein
MAIRSSVLAEVKVLSAAALHQRMQQGALADWYKKSTLNVTVDVLSEFYKCFVPIGLAKNVRIDEDWGTTPVYGIGAPTRPVLVPNNYSVSMTIEKLQLDRRNGFDYITSPDYWYSAEFQRKIGLNDWLIYSYVTIMDRESKNSIGPEIYAVLPRSASQAIGSQDVMVTHNVQLTGFKYRYKDLLGEITNNSGLLDYSRTVAMKNADEATNSVFGATYVDREQA